MGLKDLFIKSNNEDEETPVVETKKSTSKSTSVTKSSPITTPTSLGNPLVTVSTEQKNEFVDFLNEVYKKGNFQGPDYQEFTDAIKAMDSAPIDEKTKFNAIFAGFKVQGVTKTRLIDTAGKYITLIEKQSADVVAEIDKMLQQEVGAKQKDAARLTQENAEIEKQMIALTEKKNKNNELVVAINTEINEQVASLNTKRASCEAASTEFISKVKLNVEKISTYLVD